MNNNNLTYAEELKIKAIKEVGRRKFWGFFIGTSASILVFGLIAGGMYGCPRYNVWQQGLEGEAELARARQNRQITIEEAQAKLVADSLSAQSEIVRAEASAQAEVIRAKGMSDAISLEGGKLTEQYIRYLWVRNIGNYQGQVIYIPTEANLPLLEAK